MGPLKLIGFIFLSVTMGYSLGDGIDCSNSGNCATNNYLTKITCTKYGDSQNDCQCEAGPNNDCSLVTDLEGLSFVAVDDAKCMSWCESINTDPKICKFWKFMHSGFDTTCYLMDKDGCQGPAAEKCDDTSTGNDPKPPCKSGHMTRAPDCDPNIPTPPEPGTCPGPIETFADETEPDKFYQKWLCYHLPNPDPIDMYTETTMPVGGFCKLILGGDDHHGSCLKLQPEYKFICQDDGNGKGVWTKSDNTMSDEGINNDKLTDIECAASKLEKAEPAQPGREIYCENGDLTASGEVPAENFCIMTCDGYSVMSFYTDWKLLGEGRTWFYEVGAGGPKEMTDGSILDCWGKR